MYTQASLTAQRVKNLPTNAEDMQDAVSIPGSGKSGDGNGNPLQSSCLKNSHGQQSLVGYHPKGGRESEMTKHSTHINFKLIT